MTKVTVVDKSYRCYWFVGTISILHHLNDEGGKILVGVSLDLALRLSINSK